MTTYYPVRDDAIKEMYAPIVAFLATDDGRVIWAFRNRYGTTVVLNPDDGRIDYDDKSIVAMLKDSVALVYTDTAWMDFVSPLRQQYESYFPNRRMYMCCDTDIDDPVERLLCVMDAFRF